MCDNEKHTLLRYIGKFVDDWRQLTVENITIQPIGNGYINRTEVVENVSQIKTKVQKLIVKSYGKNVHGKALKVVNSSSPLEQSLIASEAARIGIGPRVFGADETGRVEEFIECATLTHQDALRADVAIAFAHFHSIQLPLCRDRCVDRERGDFSLMIRTYNELLEIARAKGYRADTVETLVAEVNWLKSVNRSIATEHRIVLVTGDSNYMNRLVVKESNSVKLIDYDCTCYSWRGIELGGHFMSRLFDFHDLDNIRTPFPYPDESEQATFLTTYLTEWKRLNANVVDDAVDCLPNLLAECYIGAMFTCLLWSWFRYCFTDNFNEQEEKWFLDEPISLGCYRETKKHFLAKYALERGD